MKAMTEMGHAIPFSSSSLLAMKRGFKAPCSQVRPPASPSWAWWRIEHVEREVNPVYEPAERQRQISLAARFKDFFSQQQQKSD